MWAEWRQTLFASTSGCTNLVLLQASNQEPIQVTIYFQYSSNESFNCYHEISCNMMWHLTTTIISYCKARPLPFTLSLYQCPTWLWLSGQLKHVVLLNRPNIHLHSVHLIIKKQTFDILVQFCGNLFWHFWNLSFLCTESEDFGVKLLKPSSVISNFT